MKRRCTTAVGTLLLCCGVVALAVAVAGCVPTSQRTLKQTDAYGAELYRALTEAQTTHGELRELAKASSAKSLSQSAEPTGVTAVELERARALSARVAAADDELATMQPGAYADSREDIDEYFQLLAESAEAWVAGLGSRDPRALEIGDRKAAAAKEALGRIAIEGRE
ncbi:MAG: hypothetical protein HY876_09350 [Coriobacteriales bacterium]|nr:hypothetical protein [Coriobacteriales bacterium]